MRETQVQSLGWEDPLEEEMATCSGILAWKIPWTEEPGRLQSMGSQKVRHYWATEHTHTHTHTHTKSHYKSIRSKRILFEQVPGVSDGQGSLVCCSPWGHKESDMTERLNWTELNRKMSNEYEVEIDQALQMARDFTGEGNGTPLQYSCLENLMDGGVWWATVHGVAQSRTRLKWLSSDFTRGCSTSPVGEGIF